MSGIREQTKTSHYEQFKQQYQVQEELGRGSYAVVHRCIQKTTKDNFAVKLVDKSKASASQLEDLRQEVKIMRELRHQRIIAVKDIFDFDPTLYIVMELVHGGDVFNVITKLTYYTENVAAEMLYNFLSALNYIHSSGIVHRDLKPDNILLKHGLPKTKSELRDNPMVLADIKVADFGFATYCGATDDLKKCCGTPYYIAPEILNCGLYKTGPPYGKQCDMWSLGVVAYVMMCGAPPFQAQKRHQLFKLIVRGKFIFSSNWDNISEYAKDFIRCLLVVDPNKRLTPSQALQHSFIKNRKNIVPQTKIKTHVSLRVAVFSVIVIHRLVYLERKAAIQSMPPSPTPRKRSLKKLVLRNIEIESTSASTIVQTLSRHPSITHIDLTSGPISRQAAKKIMHLLQVNSHIRKVEVNGSILQPSNIKTLDVLMSHNDAASRSACMSSLLPAITTR